MLRCRCNAPFLLLVWFCLLPGIDRCQGAPPEVRALIVGIRNYPNAEVATAEDSAIQFSNIVRVTYGSSAIVECLTGTNCTLGLVRTKLKDAANSPPNSLFIFFFSGHGYRNTYTSEGTNVSLGDLNLVPQAVPLSEFEQCSLPMMQYADIFGKQPVNTMAFLDCCMAGYVRAPAYHRDFLSSTIGLRGFVLTACGTTALSTTNYFFQGLTNVLLNLKSETCVTPTDLRNRVRAKVEELTPDMSPDLAFTPKVNRCIAKFNEPSCLLIASFPYGCVDSVDVSVNGQKDTTPFWFDPEIVYITQLDKGSNVINFRCRSDAVTLSLSPKDLEGSFCLCSIDWTKKTTSLGFNASAFPATVERIAWTLDNYGTPVASYFADSAIAWPKIDPSRNVRDLIDRFAQLEPNDLAAQIVSRGQLNPSDIALAYDSKERQAIPQRMRDFGAQRLAAELDSALAERTQGSERDLFAIRAAVASRAIGTNEIVSAAEYDWSSDEAREIAEKIDWAKPVGGALALSYLPTTTHDLVKFHSLPFGRVTDIGRLYSVANFPIEKSSGLLTKNDLKTITAGVRAGSRLSSTVLILEVEGCGAASPYDRNTTNLLVQIRSALRGQGISDHDIVFANAESPHYVGIGGTNLGINISPFLRATLGLR